MSQNSNVKTPRSQRAPVWEHFKVAKNKKRRDCLHCGVNICREKSTAISHINKCSEYSGDLYDDSGSIKPGSRKKDNSNTNSNSNNSKSSSSNRVNTMKNMFRSRITAAENDKSNDLLAQAIATSGPVPYQPLKENDFFKQLFRALCPGFVIASWKVIKRKIREFKERIKTKAMEYFRQSVDTAGIAFDASTDGSGSTMTAFGALIPEPYLLEIERYECETRTAIREFESLQEQIKKHEKELQVVFTEVHKDSCNVEKAVRDLYDKLEEFFAVGCSSHATMNGNKYIFQIPFFRNVWDKCKIVSRIGNTKAAEWMDKLIIYDRIKKRMIELFDKDKKLKEKHNTIQEYVKTDQFKQQLDFKRSTIINN